MLLVLLFLALVAVVSSRSRTINIVNKCPHDIWIGVLGNPTPAADSGFQVGANGGQRPLVVPTPWVSGRIWARTGCSWRTNPSWPQARFVCDTGDCGAGVNNFGVQCGGIGGQTPASLAEFTLNDNADYYDLSLVDGWNLDIAIQSVNGQRINGFGDDQKYNCGNPSCHFDSGRCPTELNVNRGGKNYCMNLCEATHNNDQRATSGFLQNIFNNQDTLALVCCSCWYGADPAGCGASRCGPADCCGCFNGGSKHCCSPYDFHLPAGHGGVCRVEEWPKVQTGYYRGQQFNTVFKNQCPDAYSWQFDDLASTYQCQNSDYIVTFCPSGGGNPPPPPPPPHGGNPPPPPPPPQGGNNGISWTQGGDWAWASGCDFKGNDLAGRSTSAADCGPTCQQTAGCTHFAWTAGNNCWLKSGGVSKGNAFQSGAAGIVCGLKTSGGNPPPPPPPPPVNNNNGVQWNQAGDWAWAMGCDFSGQDLGRQDSSGADCGPVCSRTSGCTHFSWTPGNNCWLKSGGVSKGNAFKSGAAGIVCGLRTAGGQRIEESGDSQSGLDEGQKIGIGVGVGVGVLLVVVAIVAFVAISNNKKRGETI